MSELHSPRRLPSSFSLALGLPVAFAVGFLASLAGIPVPAPPTVLGGLVVMAMTLGYLFADRFLVSRPSSSEDVCAGPSGAIKSAQVHRHD
jgi:XapX domain-containing protein